MADANVSGAAGGGTRGSVFKFFSQNYILVLAVLLILFMILPLPKFSIDVLMTK